MAAVETHYNIKTHAWNHALLTPSAVKVCRGIFYRYDGVKWRRLCNLCNEFCLRRSNKTCPAHSPVKLAKRGHSKKACRFIDQLEKDWGCKIEHIHYTSDWETSGSEREIGIFHVDGYVESKMTIIEYLGDYWHGNLRKFARDFVVKQTGKTALQLFQETCDRLEKIQEFGFTVYFIWEEQHNRGEIAPILFSRKRFWEYASSKCVETNLVL